MRFGGIEVFWYDHKQNKGGVMVVFAMVLSLQLGLAQVPACHPEPLPPQEVRSQAFWQGYLENTLLKCFGHFGKGVWDTEIVIGLGPFAAISCFGKCIAIGQDLLDDVNEAEAVTFVLGHEAGHLALEAAGLGELGATEAQYAADFLASRAISLGGCFGARMLKYWYAQIPDDFENPFILAGKKELPGRIAMMSGLCAMEGAGKGKPKWD
jgi:hypothetical protein